MDDLSLVLRNTLLEMKHLKVAMSSDQTSFQGLIDKLIGDEFDFENPENRKKVIQEKTIKELLNGMELTPRYGWRRKGKIYFFPFRFIYPSKSPL